MTLEIADWVWTIGDLLDAAPEAATVIKAKGMEPR
jgi:hypothetical protein